MNIMNIVECSHLLSKKLENHKSILIIDVKKSRRNLIAEGLALSNYFHKT